MLSTDKIEAIVQLEPLLLLGGLALVSIATYKVFLRGLRQDRHELLHRLFRNLAAHAIALGVLYLLFRLAGSMAESESPIASIIESKLYPYLGFLAIVSGSIVFVKLSRIFAFEYLFFVSMRAGVPVLLVNILSLALSICLAGWIATEVFGVRLAPVLATSALISVILGLALQDTLGNLFAGVALQFDKPYEIGDWVEIQNDGMKWAGQVHEITWRSTVLTGILDELITIPNRLIGQSQVAAFGSNGKPFWRGMNFRIPFGQPVEQVRKIMHQAISSTEGVCAEPAPRVYLSEIGDSGMNFRVVFCIQDYGAQFRINDWAHTSVMAALVRNAIPIATPAMRVQMVENGWRENAEMDKVASPVDG